MVPYEFIRTPAFRSSCSAKTEISPRKRNRDKSAISNKLKFVRSERFFKEKNPYKSRYSVSERINEEKKAKISEHL